MAKLKFYYDIRSGGDTHPVRIALTHKSETRYFLTSVELEPQYWDAAALCVVKHPNARLMNHLLSTRLHALEEKLLMLEIEGANLRGLTCGEVKSLLEGKPLKSHLFLPALRAYIRAATADGTRRVYEQTLDKVQAYAGESAGVLTFEDMTLAWLRDFDAWLAGSMSVNSRAIQMRNIRAVFNRALDDEVITCYPFRKFRIKHEATRKRSLTVEQLRAFRDMQLTEAQGVARDFFLLTFYLIGINTADLLPLTQITSEGRVEYRRAKTGKLYSVKVEPEALALIEKYRGKEHLLSFGDKYNSYDLCHVFAHRYRNIRDFVPVSIYWARHTWATIAAELDIPKETIAAALGHGGNSVTDIYIRFDQRKVDAANRRVIDYLNSE